MYFYQKLTPKCQTHGEVNSLRITLEYHGRTKITNFLLMACFNLVSVYLTIIRPTLFRQQYHKNNFCILFSYTFANIHVYIIQMHSVFLSKTDYEMSVHMERQNHQVSLQAYRNYANHFP